MKKMRFGLVVLIGVLCAAGLQLALKGRFSSMSSVLGIMVGLFLGLIVSVLCIEDRYWRTRATRFSNAVVNLLVVAIAISVALDIPFQAPILGACASMLVFSYWQCNKLNEMPNKPELDRAGIMDVLVVFVWLFVVVASVFSIVLRLGIVAIPGGRPLH